MGKSKKQKIHFIVVREFSGKKAMHEAFEQAIEHQTYEQFEKWMANHESKKKAA